VCLGAGDLSDSILFISSRDPSWMILDAMPKFEASGAKPKYFLVDRTPRHLSVSAHFFEYVSNR
jgi:hypothetical protein